MKCETQQSIDSFYMQKGPCCAGCDWWRWINLMVGECRRNAPVSGKERTAMLGFTLCTLSIPAGHVMTERDHHCGDFKDSFDWSSLPMLYLKRIGHKEPTP